ncbi:scoloptoxin SSD14-like [Dermacentor andersoni]|uniref:scoloptoxin SSD14-like n=1 Tax=Dermacentor andersoni TaxID=34620 RepID=UPI00215549E7
MNRRKSFAVERKERMEKERKERKQHHRKADDELADAAKAQGPSLQLKEESPTKGASPPQPPDAEETKQTKISRKMSRKMSRIDEYKSYTTSGGGISRPVTEETRRKRQLQLSIVLLGLAVMAAFFLSLVLYVTVFMRRSGAPRQPRYVSPTPTASFAKWVAVTGDTLCKSEARRMFDMNGTVGDAAVATMLCLCVVLPYRCGLGGGFIATYYNRQSQEARAIVAREVAPASAFPDMYRERANQSLHGFTAVAVFGELRGYEALLNLTGTNVPWNKLFAKAIEYADSGFEVSAEFAQVIQEHSQAISDDYTRTLRQMLMNAKTGKFFDKGDIFHNKVLAQTLKNISDNPLKGSSLSTGPLAEAMLGDINKYGNEHITLTDLKNYEPWVARVQSLQLSNEERVLVPLPPSGGVLTAFALSIIDNFRSNAGLLPDDVLSAHRVVEALKFAYGTRPKMGDLRKVPRVSSLISSIMSPDRATEIAQKISSKPHPNVEDYGLDSVSAEDHGSGQLVIVAPDGDAIAMTSTINTPFGALVASSSTGIILNNQMHDFSTQGTADVYGFPAGKENDIAPGKSPMSSLTPLIVVDRSGDVLFVGSALGGTKCTSALTQVVVRTLWMQHTVKEAIDAGRLHNHLLPENVVRYEKTADKDVLWWLKKQGHVLASDQWQGDVIAVQRVQSEKVYRGNYDFRHTSSGALDGA